MTIFDEYFELSTKSHVGIPGGERELVDTIQSRFSLDFILSCPARIDGFKIPKDFTENFSATSFYGHCMLERLCTGR